MSDLQSKPNLKKSLASTMVWSFLVIFVFFGLFGGWLATAPLSSAAVATGVVSPDGSRKTIQHLEGGIINEILVRDGDKVTAGQPLITLADVQAKAQFTGFQAQWLRLRSIRQRTKSLQLNLTHITFPTDIIQHAGTDQEFAYFLTAQSDLFKTRFKAHLDRKRILKRQVAQIKEQLLGLKAEYDGNNEQLDLIEEELKGLRQLLKSGNVRKSRVLQMRRAYAEVQSKSAATRASIASANQKINEIEISATITETEYRDKLSDEYMRINGEIAQIEERLGASSDVLKRTAVIAPIDGVVVGLRFKTPGGVIRPGDLIMELVPSDDKLVIDARIQPIDIDDVHTGLRAQIHLLSFEQRHMPIIEGILVFISADATTDERTGESYFKAKVVIPNDQLKDVAAGIVLLPGMPADVMIVTGERSALRYIFEPVWRSLRTAFRQK